MRKNHKGLEKSELKYLGLALLLSFVLVFIITNNVANGFISNLNPILQFFLITFNIYFMMVFVFKATAMGTKKVFMGALGTTLSAFAIDALTAEYHVGANGLVAGGIFGKGAVDYVIGYLLTLLNVPANTTYTIFSKTFTVYWLALSTYSITAIALIFIVFLFIKNAVKKKI